MLRNISGMVLHVNLLPGFFKDSKHEKGDKACLEMGFNTIVATEINPAGMKIILHNAERFFNFPAALGNAEDNRPLQWLLLPFRFIRFVWQPGNPGTSGKR